MTTVKSLSREMKFFLLALIPIYFISVGLIIQPFDSIVTGIYEIIREPDFLITDYIAVGGMGAAFVNAGMMALISIYFVYSLGMEMDGHTITSCCLMFGFSLFGKNLMNIWAIFLGVFLYAKYHKMHLSNYIYVGIYGTSLSPIITQLMHVVELPIWQRFCVTILVGICIGFVLPPLATHSHYAHKGYSLYNVGFASGIIATVLVSTFKSFGIETEARLIWSSGNDAMLLGLLFVLFAGMSVVAVLWRGKDTLLGYEKLLATTGIGGTDYLLELGGAVTLLNMGLNGLFATFFVLAVGGGSVIDSAKAIAMGVATKTDPWQFASTGTKPDTTLPVGTVLTLAASGSESSNSCVLTNEETKEKRGITSETNRPRISFLDPENTYTVSKFQTGCGIVDIMMHTLERYLTPEGGESDITDRIAEGLLIAVRDAGRRAIANPRDYEARASLMWAGSVSHNDYTGCGRKRLFPVHKLEHELSAFRDEIAHGAGLSVLFPAWALYEMKNDFPRFAQLANRVFGVEMDFHHPERTAREGILTMKRFFEEIGMPTHLAQLGIKPENYAQLAANTVRTVKGPVKSYSALDEQAIIEIYKLAE